MNDEQKDKIYNLLHANEFCVISTNQPGLAPESAVISFSELEDMQLIFGTFQGSRKYQNIKQDNKVSLALGWDNTTKQTLQIEGYAMEVNDADRLRIEDIHCKKNPSSERFRGKPEQRYFIVKPYWLKYSDYSVHPQEIWELHFE